MSAIKTPIMYIQRGWDSGRIGRVLESLQGRGYKANFIDRETHEYYWISGPRRDGQDTLYPGRVEIDADVVEAYWRDVRGEPGTRTTSYRSLGVHGRHATR